MSVGRLPKINRQIQKTIGEVFHEEVDFPREVLVTVSNVETRKNLQTTLVWLYIFPLERGEEILTLLKGQIYDIQGAFNRKMPMRPLPRLQFTLDHGAQYAARIDQKLQTLQPEETTPPTGPVDSSETN